MAALRKEKEAQKSFETHELIPYACHLTFDTLITKNVELVQFIKLSSNASLSDDDLRATVRAAINETIDPAKIAVWIHTARTLKEIVESGNEDYVNRVDILWKKALPNELRFTNNIYITLVIDFKKFPLWQPQNYLRALSNWAEERRFNQVIEQHKKEITAIADTLIFKLKKFDAKRLELVKRNDTYYSEPMEMLHKLLTFTDRPIPIRLGDISKNLFKEKFSFNLYNGQITMSTESGNYYGTVISLKEATLLSAYALKELLNTGYELLISESIDFARGNKSLADYRYQRYINSLTDDKKFIEIMGGRDAEPLPQDFARHQVNILIMRPSQKEFALALKDLNEKLAELGIISYVEDLRLERSFWSMLPGNFSFIKRQELVSRQEIASFASFGIDKFTDVADCMFGEPVTFFENHEGGAFALHFLTDGQSNILIAGEQAEKRQVLANLITAQAARFGLDIIFYDETGEYENFAKSVNALYMKSLDLAAIKGKLKDKTLLVINSMAKILGSGDILDPIFDFIDEAAAKNAMIIACVDFKDNCEALLPNFRAQIFLNGNIENYADHFDLFEDEIRIIDLLDADSFYFKHGYDELVLNFKPTEKLIKALLTGGIQ